MKPLRPPQQTPKAGRALYRVIGRPQLYFAKNWRQFSVSLCDDKCKKTDGCGNLIADVRLYHPKGKALVLQVGFLVRFQPETEQFCIDGEARIAKRFGGSVRKARGPNSYKSYWYDFEGDPTADSMKQLSLFLDTLDRCGARAGWWWFKYPLAEIIRLQVSGKGSRHA